MLDIRRRQFITLLGGAAAAWPLVARAQQPREPMRRIGVLLTGAADDPESLARVGAFLQGLQELGWTDGRNVRIEYRWGSADAERIRKSAAELVALAPDVIVVSGNSGMVPLQRATRTLPIVFVNASDPVGGGFAASLARPGGNVTGFASIEYGMSGKWLELLKQISPSVTRAAVIRDPSIPSGSGQLGAIQAVGPFLGVEVTPIDAREAGEIERAVTDFARLPNGGLIVQASTSTIHHRKLIITLAARHRLPAVYPYRLFVGDGGLLSYGADSVDSFRRAAGYVDRILKGEKPADLPVQAPTKYELVVNLKTAKVLGLEIPTTVLARADEVIE
jgi:putative tryptophan/tyrosine transport system substrate-binding protein